MKTFTYRSSRREEALTNGRWRCHSRCNRPNFLFAQPRQLLAESKPLQRFNASTLQRAFTLIELLVVIAIAAILSAMLLTAGGVMVQKSNLQRATSERDQIETAIEAYHSKYGYYPPSSQATGNPLVNQLYYELIGTTNVIYQSGNPAFETLDGSSEINTQTVVKAFGVSAFMNCSKNGAGGEDVIPAQSFLTGLKSGEMASNGTSGVMMIVTAANSDSVYVPMPGVYSEAGRPANPWRYVCPGTNNPNSYDLWVQVYVGKHTNLICNWSKARQLDVPMP